MYRRPYSSIPRAVFGGLLASVALSTATVARAQNPPVSVLTQRYDNFRTGMNPREAVLNTSNVQPATFGRLFTRMISGNGRTQPLYVQNLNIQGATRNVVFVTTQTNFIYAFDADNPLAPTLWSANLTPPGGSTGETIGLFATPVINPATNTLYAVCKTLEGPSTEASSYIFRLHALNILTGQENPNSPVQLSFSVPGTGPDAVNGVISLNAMNENMKTSLLFTRNHLVFGFCTAINETSDLYHGFVAAYYAPNLSLTGAWCTTPNGSRGGIWQSANGLITDDAGDIWAGIGNGTTDNNSDYGMGVVRLTLSNSGLTLADYFIPYNYAQLNLYDTDISSTGPMHIPGTSYGIQGGKQGYLYVLNPFNLGGLSNNDANIPQRVFASNGEIHGDPTPYVRSSNKVTLYSMGEDDNLRAYNILPSGLLDINSAYTSSTMSIGPGGMLIMSSHSGFPGTGVLWCYRAASAPVSGYQPALMEAYDPETLNLLWSSNQTPSRDLAGTYAKWLYPTVANGKVYLSSSSSDFIVYGLIPSGVPAAPTGLSAQVTSFVSPGTIQLTWSPVPGAVGYNVRNGPLQGGPYNLLDNNITATTASQPFKTIGTNQFNYYVVSAVNAQGESVNSQEFAFSPWPSAPVIAESNVSGSPKISWPAANRAQTYSVLRGTQTGGPYTTVLTSGYTSLSFTDTTAVPGTTYYYVATSTNTFGTSGYSNEVHN